MDQNEYFCIINGKNDTCMQVAYFRGSFKAHDTLTAIVTTPTTFI